MNIIVTAVQVPFSRGGAEVLVDGLVKALKAAGHNTELVQLPFFADPKEDLLKSVALWRSLDLRSFGGKEVDLVIPTKFPSYVVKHPRKSLWLIHQHRQMYDLYQTRFGDFCSEARDEALRQMLMEADTRALEECKNRYTISTNVSKRLKRYLNIESAPLLPPLPLAGRYQNAPEEGYILSVGRLCSIKRVDLMIKSLSRVQDKLRLKIVGTPDEPGIEQHFQDLLDLYNMQSRVDFLGRVSDQELLELYARSYAVYYAPYDEDYGYVTLETLASGKPVITALDSGGVLEFVRHEENGLVCDPTEEGISRGINRLVSDASLYTKLCEGAKTSGQAFNSTWQHIIEKLLSY
ncbi:glycosyltransferase family 4 protein [bacterium]|nr:glycosyltransferase family 4 protein [bacterium]